MQSLPEIKPNKIYNMDCLEGMKQIPNKTIDLIITDPPYGINFKSNMDTKNRFERIINDNNLNFFEPFTTEAFRILKENSCILIFCRFDNYPYFYETCKKTGFHIKNCLVWEKNKALGGLGDMESSFLNNYEFILFAMKDRKILFKEGHNREFGLIQDKTISNPSQLLYPTQKPTKIIHKLIAICSEKNDIILDPFIGSGTTAIVCKQLRRNFIGFDLSKNACAIANKRLSQQTLHPWNSA